METAAPDAPGFAYVDRGGIGVSMANAFGVNKGCNPGLICIPARGVVGVVVAARLRGYVSERAGCFAALLPRTTNESKDLELNQPRGLRVPLWPCSPDPKDRRWDKWVDGQVSQTNAFNCDSIQLVHRERARAGGCCNKKQAARKNASKGGPAHAALLPRPSPLPAAARSRSQSFFQANNRSSA